VQELLAGRIPLLDALFPRFASRLIRNAATFGGNLATASPIGDAAPVLLALDASIVLAGPAGTRVVELADFFTGYRHTALLPGELIVAIEVPLPLAGLTSFRKVAKRHLDDISGVAIALALDLGDGVITRATIGLGGVAATPIRARATEAALVGQPWDAGTAARAAAVLREEGSPIDDHRASADYRRTMLGNALLRLQAEGAVATR
jgi:xanthine dehydrogenase small subunit